MATLQQLYDENKYFLDEHKDFANEMFRKDISAQQTNLSNMASLFARQASQEASRFRDTAAAGGEGDLQNAYATTMFMDPIQQAYTQANQQRQGLSANLQNTMRSLDEGYQNRNLNLFGMEDAINERNRKTGFGDVLGGLFDIGKAIAPALIMASSKEYKKNVKKVNPKQKLEELLSLANKVKDYEYKEDMGDTEVHTGIIIEEVPEMADDSGRGIPMTKVTDLVFKSLAAMKDIDSRLAKLEKLRG